MNLTLTQAIDRTRDLSGIIKAARAHEADCAADHEAKLNIAEIAGEAHQKAIEARKAFEQEREELAEHVAALVRKTGDVIEPDAPAYNSIFTEPADFQAQALQNGADKITAAFNEATGR